MPIFVDTLNDETFNGLTEADERNDGDGLSLREAIGVLNAAGGVDSIVFDPSLFGQTFNISSNGPLGITADIEITGTVNILNESSNSAFELSNGASVTFEDFSLAHSATSDRTAVIQVLGDNVSLTNSANITGVGTGGFLGDRTIAINITGDNFTLVNEADGEIVTEGRRAIEGISNFNGSSVDYSADITNHGLIEGADDVVSITTGTVTNSGTIRTTHLFDLGGRLEPGETSDAIQFWGAVNAGYVTPAAGEGVVNNLATGVIDGGRSAIFLTGSGTVNNDGLITALITAITNSPVFSSVATPTPITINNAGIITNEGFTYDSSFNGASSTITLAGSDQTTAIEINNSGTISAQGTVITIENGGATLNNDAQGQIVADLDLSGDDAIAYLGNRLEDYPVGTFQNLTFSLSQNPNIVSEDGTFVFNGQANALQLNTNGSVFPFATQNGIPILELSNATGPAILARVDIAATMQAGVVVFLIDTNDNFIFPASIDITSSVGTLTVSSSATGVTVVDAATSQPVFNPPSNINFADDIDNAGTITGDIMTGLGDDVAVNTGTINGELFLGQGDDNFTRAGAGSNDFVFGGDGNDTLTGDTDAAAIIDIFYGEDGNDDLNGGAGNDRLFGGDGADDLNGGSDQDRLAGGAGNDALFGGTGSDVLIGGAGDDTLDGFTGFDTAVYSGLSTGVTVDLQITTAQDTIGAGMDTLIRVENLFGSGQDDTLTGNSNRNRLDGSAGNDMLFGLGNNDTLLGGTGNDSLWGGDGADRLFAGLGNDNLYGDAGRDRLEGSDGNDRLFGGDDVDRLLGGDGNDLLVGGEGTDFLFGGAGADRFDYNSINDSGVGVYNRDEIRDFNSAEGDRIDVFGIDANENVAGNQAFILIEGSFTGTAGEIMIQSLVRSGVEIQLVSLDVDGDAQADMQLWVLSGELDASDFVL